MTRLIQWPARLLSGAWRAPRSAASCTLSAALVLGAVVAVPAVPRTSLAQQPPPQAPPGEYTPPPPQAPQSGFDSGMQAGGMQPPPPMGAATPAQASPPPPPSRTEQSLEISKKADSGDGLKFLYLGAEGGLEHVGLRTLEADTENITLGFVDSTATGPFVGGFLGLKLLFITLGPRFRYGFLNSYDKLTIGGELGLHIPLGPIEPHVEVGGGYVKFTGFRTSFQTLDEAFTISGAYGRALGGIDIHVSEAVSIGGSVSAELMGLKRPGLSTSDIDKLRNASASAQTLSDAEALALKANGTSVGLGFTAAGAITLRF